MSWLDRLLGKDPAEELARAERFLAGGEPVRALEIARRLDRSRDMAVRSQAASLLQQARDALVSKTLANAEEAEKAGDPADAADWIRAALHHLGDGVQRAELETRLEVLENRIEEAPVRSLLGRDEAEPSLGMEMELDVDTRYEMLMGMLVEDVVHRYEDRSAAFREAVVEINEGEAEPALSKLDDLVARNGSDPVLHFERGRARLMLERWTGAREDFEAAWTRLGDEPLDLGESLSVPLLWAETVLGQGDAGALLDRLRELAAPEAGNPELSALYVQALLSRDRRDEARELLIALCRRHRSRQDFSHVLASLMAQDGETMAAVRLLETSVKPSCAGGSCSKPPLHLPSLRLLAKLHLDADSPPSRVEELLMWIAHAQGGKLAAPDHRLMARYHEAMGDPDAGRESRLAAERLEREGRSETVQRAEVLSGGLDSPGQAPPI